MKNLSREEALQILASCEREHGGKWVPHSKNVAALACMIAELCHMDAEFAYGAALLHDVGRYAGATYARHGLDGFLRLKSLGHERYARYCLTHSYYLPDGVLFSLGENDLTEEESRFSVEYTKDLIYDDYDYLVQLADNLAGFDGFCTLQERMIDVALRYPFNDEFIKRMWKRQFELKALFDARLGCSIYRFLPGLKKSLFK